MAKFKLRNKLNDDSDFERILDEETKYIANEQSFKNENEQVSEEEDGPLIEQSIQNVPEQKPYLMKLKKTKSAQQQKQGGYE